VTAPLPEEQLLRSVYEAFNSAIEHGDDLEPLIADLYTDDFRMEPGEPDTWFGGGTVHELMNWWRIWLAEVAEVRLDVLAVRSTPGGQEVDVHASGRFKRSGIRFDADYTHLVGLRDGRVATLHVRRGLAGGDATSASTRERTGTTPA